METASITAIRNLATNIQDNLEAYRKYQKDNSVDTDAYSYGNENEYSIKGIIAGIKNVLTDVLFLTKSHNLFIKLSTYSDRTEIQSHLSNLNSQLAGKQNRNIVSELEWLKKNLRTYNLRLDRERYIAFNSAIDELCRKAITLENEIQSVKDKLVESCDTYTEIQTKQSEYNEIISEITEKKDSFVEEYNSFVNEVNDFRQLAEKAKTNELTISENLEETNKEKAVFDDFIEKIDDRERTLVKQSESTNEYERKLSEFEKEHKSKLDEVGALINKARQALQYTTAAGMSAAFQEQYDKANNVRAKIGWLIAAIVFLALSLGIGAWIVAGWGIKDDSTTQLYSLIGRLTMVPFTLLAAIFCANQFVKQKNLAEDYAYKSVLTKSIVAFSEELREKDGKGYSEYISTVLKEIHQDPLRKRSKEKDEITMRETTGLLGKALDILQSFSSKV